jgi:hypothetical protein
MVELLKDREAVDSNSFEFGLIAFAHPETGEIWVAWGEAVPPDRVKAEIWLNLGTGETKPGKGPVALAKTRPLSVDEREFFDSQQSDPVGPKAGRVLLSDDLRHLTQSEWDVETASFTHRRLCNKLGVRQSLSAEAFRQLKPKFLH